MPWPEVQPFVGRETELEVLDGLAEQVRRGAGGTVVVVGEPGIGKTRLVDEAVARAADLGVRAAWGRCREEAVAPPLWPWLQVLRRLGIAPDDPELLGAGTAGHGDADRYALFDRLTERLLAAAAAQPLLVVLDDVHRADEASLRLLAFFGDVAWPAPIGVVVTARAGDVDRGMAGAVLEDLTRSTVGRRLDLVGLPTAAVRAWVDQVAPGTDDAALHDRSGGNPLFVEQLLAVRGDPGVPATLVDLIDRRLAGLPPTTRELLGLAGVAGREVDDAVLAAAAGVEPRETLRQLDPAVRARLVAAAPEPGRHRFVHALVRDGVVAGLAPSALADAHARVLGALLDLGAGGAAERAQHALAAGPLVDEDLVRRLVVAAAEEAERYQAWEDAVRWWERARDLGASSHGVSPAGSELDLAIRLGSALLAAGDVGAARRCLEEAVRAAASAGDGPRLAAAALVLGDTVAEVAPDQVLVGALDRALVGPGVDPGDRVRLAARRAMATYWEPGGQSDARRRSAAALADAEVVGDRALVGAALIARVFTLRGPDHLDERLAAGEEALAIASELGDDELRARAWQWVIPDRFQTGDLLGVRSAVSALAASAEARRDPLRRWWSLVYEGLLAEFDGRDDVPEVVEAAAALGRRLGQPAADAYRLGQLARHRWRVGGLDDLVDELRAATSRFPGLVTFQADLALAEVATGDHDRAVGRLGRLVADGCSLLPRDSLYLATLAILAEVAVATRSTGAARVLLDELGPHAARNLIQGVPVGWGAGAWHLARLHDLLGHDAEAADAAALADALHARWGAQGFGPARSSPPDERPAGLTPREQQVLRLLAVGRANKEIAAELGVSTHTVERHVANVFTKIGVGRRAEAAAWAHARGLVPGGSLPAGG